MIARLSLCLTIRYAGPCDILKIIWCYASLLYSLFYSFAINATSGVISTSSQLDREQRAEPFNLLVTATDQDETVANRNQVSVSLIITGLSFKE